MCLLRTFKAVAKNSAGEQDIDRTAATGVRGRANHGGAAVDGDAGTEKLVRNVVERLDPSALGPQIIGTATVGIGVSRSSCGSYWNVALERDGSVATTWLQRTPAIVGFNRAIFVSEAKACRGRALSGPICHALTRPDRQQPSCKSAIRRAQFFGVDHEVVQKKLSLFPSRSRK